MDNLYPDHPGAKGQTFTTYATSAEAADSMARCVKFLQTIALRTLAALGEATVLECVAITDFPRETLQPRFSELIRAGLEAWVRHTAMDCRTRAQQVEAVPRIRRVTIAHLHLPFPA